MHISKNLIYIHTRFFLPIILAIVLSCGLNHVSGQNFGLSKLDLNGTAFLHPTSLDFGPDGKLYVAEEEGKIFAFSIERIGANDYRAVDATSIHLIQQIPNHHEDGTAAPEINKRKVNGLVATGSSSNPVLYISSYDPRAGVSGKGDMNLDTNSGIISKLTWNGQKWEMVHLVRGLPRGKEKHGSNGLFLDQKQNTLYVAQAGHTNAGAPSKAFALSSEYALSAGILSIDLATIEALPTKIDAEGQAYKYDLLTVKHNNEIGRGDISSSKVPWGGLDGINQSRLVLGGPVQVYAPGFRDPYDVLISNAGFMYVSDNGSKPSMGATPDGAGAPSFDGHRYISQVNNLYLPDSLQQPIEDLSVARLATTSSMGANNSLHLVTKGYFGGHPNPIRANPSGAGLFLEGRFRIDASQGLPQEWPPVDPALANPIEGSYQHTEGAHEGVLLQVPEELKGLTEYTASNFNSALKGDILFTSFGNVGKIQRISPSTVDGSGYPAQLLISGLGNGAIDIDALGDEEIFPGTIWTLLYHENKISILEPADYSTGVQTDMGCSRTPSSTLDDDGDGYSNADELDPRNGTDPCSKESFPIDRDGSSRNGFKLSNWNDADDDDDGIKDILDPFVWDASNGAQLNMQSLPLHVSFSQRDAQAGPLGKGMTGLMVNGTTDYQELESDITRKFPEQANNQYVISQTGAGSPIGTQNNDEQSYQMGIKLCDASEPVWVRSQINGPFFNGGSSKEYLQGMYIGTGDQDNFLLLALNGDGKGGAGFSITEEIDGEASTYFYPVDMILANTQIGLYWELDPYEKTAQAYYSKGTSEDLFPIGPKVRLSGKTLSAFNCSYQIQGVPSYLAMGLLANSGSAPSFTASYDFLEVYTERQSCSLQIAEKEIDFKAISEQTNKCYTLQLNNPLMFKMDIDEVKIVGEHASLFSVKPRSLANLHAKKTAKLDINFKPKSSGYKQALLQIYTSCSPQPIEIPLKGMGATFSEVLYRVNAGGMEIPATDGGLDWMADENREAVKFLSQGGGDISKGTSSGNLSYHSSVPVLTPTELFERGRVSAPKKNMNWSFPVSGKAGTLYQVCLYMVNSASRTAEKGQRVFTLEIEGQQVAQSVDLSGQYGHQTAVTLCFPVKLQQDGKLDIVFLREQASPLVNAVEIRGTEDKFSSSQVEIEDFQARVQNKNVRLDWSTMTEANNQGFVIQMMQERDGNAALFQDLIFVPSQGDSQWATSYSHEISDLVPDTYVFRLKQLDNSGNYTYSQRIHAEILSDEIGLYTYPNPTKGMLNITLTTQKEMSVRLNLLHVDGKKVQSLFEDTLFAGSHKLGFNIGDLPNGIYLLEASNGQIRKVNKVILSK